MEAYVYIDLLFLLNFCMDYTVMRLSCRLLGKRAGRRRCALGAALGALSNCVFFALGGRGAAGILVGVAGVMGGLAAAFAPFRVREYLNLCACAAVLTFALGGGCMAAYYLWLAPGGSGGGFPAWLLAASACAAFALTKAAASRARRAEAVRKAMCELSLTLCGKETTVAALADTGHSLSEPISHSPVVIVEYAALCAILPENVQRLFGEGGGDDLERVMDAFMADGISARLRVIPYRSVGVNNGVLAGFRPDCVTVGGKPVAKVVVAVYNGCLDGNGLYRALLNPELL